MISLKDAKTLFIRPETLTLLRLIKGGLLADLKTLPNLEQSRQMIELAKTSKLNKYAYIFAPFGKKNQAVAKSLEKGERVTLLVGNDIVGHIDVEDTFAFEPSWANQNLFSYPDELGKKQYGEIGISGDFTLLQDPIATARAELEKLKKMQNAHTVTVVALTADPFNRAHERLVRMTVDKADILVIILKHTSADMGLAFQLRQKMMEYFIQSYLPPSRVIIIPLENADALTLHEDPSIECLLAARLGATKIVLGQKHTGIGMFYDAQGAHTVLDFYKENLGLDIVILPELVYCNKCRTIVSTKTCPHGQHHHINYHSDTIKQLFFAGIIPPAILMRPDISAMILESLFPARFCDIQRLCDELFPSSGLIEERSERDFYEELMKLYQTGSLT